MKTLRYQSVPRSPFSIGLFFAGALLLAISGWQGLAAFTARSVPAVAVQPVSLGEAIYELRAIETLRPGDEVLAFNPETGKREWKTVENALVRVTDHLRILTIRNVADDSEQTIKTTDEHPFWVPGHQWVNAGDLSQGDKLLTDDGRDATVVATLREDHPEMVTVHNLTIRDLHTYYVAQDTRSHPVLVHNADCAKALAKAGKEAAEAAIKKADDAANAAKLRPIKAGDVTTYSEFKTRSVVGDNLEGHEVWQHANLKSQGHTTTRLGNDASRNNPVVALDVETHKAVNKAQRVVDAANQTARQNIEDNARILREQGVPRNVVNKGVKEAVLHAQRLGEIP